MSRLTLRHEYLCDEPTFWDECIFGLEFARRLYLEVLRFPGFELLAVTDEASRRTKKVRIDPPVGGLPSSVKRLLGDRFAYVEEGTLDKATGRYSYTVTPSLFADKSKTFGEVFCEPLGPRRFVRVAAISVDVRVLGIGGMLEAKILGDTKRSYETGFAFAREYLESKGLWG